MLSRSGEEDHPGAKQLPPLAESPVWVDLRVRRQTICLYPFASVTLKLSTFGPIALMDNAAPVLQGRRKVLAVLAYLAHAQHGVDRIDLARRFWPTSEEGRAKHSLRQTLSELRSVLGDGLEIGPDLVRIRPEALTIDTRLFLQEIADQRWTDALKRWQGDFLSGLEDVGDDAWRHWLAKERATFSQQLALAKDATGEMPIIPAERPAPRAPAPAMSEPEVPGPAPAPRKDFSLGQLGMLSTEARALVETAAIIGSRVPRALVCRVAGLSEAGFDSAISELSALGLFVPSTTRPGQYEFCTVTARQRIYDVMAASRRRRLHASVSDALARGVGDESVTTTAEHHALLAVAPRPVTNWPAIAAIVAVVVTLATIVLLARP